MTRIEIEIEDYLDEIATHALIEELRRREIGFEAPTGRQIAQRLRGAFYRRDASQFEAILAAHLDPIEIKEGQATSLASTKGAQR